MSFDNCALLRVLTMVLACGVNTSQATQFFVSTTGSDTASGLNGAPWRTLQKAANQVAAGDKVTVLPGNYTGFHLTKSGTAANPIEFFAQPGVLINDRNAVTNDGINLENASYIVVDGFSVTGMGRAGVRSVGADEDDFADHVTIRNVTATNNGDWGIFTGFVNDLLIENNKTSGSIDEHGIYVSNSGDRPIIRNNDSWNNTRAGIHMNGDASLGGDGIISNAVVSGNKIYNNGVGFGVGGINMDGVQDSRIENNLLFDSHGSGISLYQIDGGEGASGNVVVNNTIHMASDGNWALNIQDDSPNNTVLNNILISGHSFRGAIDISDEALVGLTSDYNLVIPRFNVTFDEDLGIEEDYTFAEWKSTYNQDAHSISVNPAQYAALFANFASRNFQLSSTSLAKNAGTSNLTPLFDILGATRPSGAGFDIGAYELSAGLAGDFNADGKVNGRDFLIWQRNTSVGSLAAWQTAYGAGSLVGVSIAIPEPATVFLLLVSSLGVLKRRHH